MPPMPSAEHKSDRLRSGASGRFRGIALAALGLLVAPAMTVICGCAYHVEPFVRTAPELFPPSRTVKQPCRVLVYYRAPLEQHMTPHTSILPYIALHPRMRFCSWPQQHLYTGVAFDSLLVSCLSANMQKVRRTRGPSTLSGKYDYIVVIDRFVSYMEGTFTFDAFVSCTCEVQDRDGRTIAKRQIEGVASAVTGMENDNALWAMERGLGEALEKSVLDCVMFVVATVKAEGEKK